MTHVATLSMCSEYWMDSMDMLRKKSSGHARDCCWAAADAADAIVPWHGKYGSCQHDREALVTRHLRGPKTRFHLHRLCVIECIAGKYLWLINLWSWYPKLLHSELVDKGVRTLWWCNRLRTEWWYFWGQTGCRVPRAIVVTEDMSIGLSCGVVAFWDDQETFSCIEFACCACLLISTYSDLHVWTAFSMIFMQVNGAPLQGANGTQLQGDNISCHGCLACVRLDKNLYNTIFVHPLL